MKISLSIIKLYLGEYDVWGVEFLSFSRGKSLIGITWDEYKFYIDFLYCNIIEYNLKK